ncbi:NUDIX domain-containing protein [Legionella jordanis]|uniref:CTP pyrophosphohydrolase n=1 Tax=Legionella jordanis TaxID=456 RepID=A0A0W0V9J3_9GAMM|nr:NUDIX domain-containing protein [Legionella jordanis]KTD16796.1 CTP pyrophosphohydrolase [Legionella jordanis]RMX03678.1 NUDIX domain-containing protein [Legionella jordanis]RMX22261.1 NUDIX domain-containing protein [Legionella jordanis]VEH11737.1 CTP pyrophosphohydrolase [Legionella jordanis]HAT8712951.1 NUDIX domain-containing protein [Legionella jordanis]
MPLIKPVSLSELRIKDYRSCYVDCIILNHDNKILLQQRGENWHNFPGFLSAFGGAIEPDETPHQALMRELHEELGAEPLQEELIFISALTEDITQHSTLIYCYFWHDSRGSIKACYEGEVKQFTDVDSILKQSKLMDNVAWVVRECRKKHLLI